jgi:capsular exopolysaccharide synthesis family protein
MLGKNKSHFYRPSSKDQDFPKQLNLVSKWRPQSVVAEQFRVAATRLDLLGDRPMGNVALISSAMKGEGKTSTVANLSYTLARDLDEPTLVIDCDYKCPNLHNVFTLPPYPGVADYLAGEVPLESCFQQIQDLPLWVMPAGDMESNPVSLSKLQHLSSLIESVRSRYRFIILDCPPILPLADINVLSGFADILIMVVRSGVTPKDVVQKAKEMLHSSKPTRLILNDAWSQGVPYYVRAGYSAPYSLTSPG